MTRLVVRLLALFRRRRLDAELTEELSAHLDFAAAENLARGMSPDEARRAAALKFGGTLQTAEAFRAQRGFPLLESIAQDLRYALRGMRRSPAFTAVAVATLAIGIGINAAVFTVVNATLIKGFPLVHRNDRLLYMTTSRWCCVSYPDFEDWRAQAKSFSGMGIVRGLGVTVSDQNGFPERDSVTEVSANTFSVVGQSPILGRDFAPSDEAPGAAPVTILRYGFWERRYGKDPAVIGRTVRLNGLPTTIVGVMPRGFSFPQDQDLWVPLVPTGDLQARGYRNTWLVFGRMADGVSVEGARAEIQTIARRLKRAYPLTNNGFTPLVWTFGGFFIGSNAIETYRILWGAVGLVLLIACANVANLLLARATGRSREMAIRIALGGGRWRITRQLVVESVMLSGLGGFVGWWLATATVRVYALWASGAGISDSTAGWFGHVLDYSMDYRVLAYLIAISVGTGLLFGLAPACRLSRLDVSSSLKDGGRGAVGGRRERRASSALVVTEMALAVLLVTGAGVMIRSFLSLYTGGLGVDTGHLLTAAVNLPKATYPGAPEQSAFYDRLVAQIAGLPGVESVALADVLPGQNTFPLPYELDGAPSVDEARRPMILQVVIGADYFKTVGTAVLAGREFSERDGPSGVPVAIVNQRFASQQWPGQNAVGKRLRFFNGKVARIGGGQSLVTGRLTPDVWLTVVGVAANIAQNSATQRQFDPLVYVPYRQKPTAAMRLLARSLVPPGTLAGAVRGEVQTLDPELPVSDVATLADSVTGIYQYKGVTAALFMVFAAIAVLLASVGLYAVIAHWVSGRTQEIGVRTAMGATARDILALVLQQGMRPVGIGLAIGLAAALVLTPILRSQLVQVSPADPIAFAAAPVVLLFAAALGCLMPALRATRVDPVVALRHD